MLPSAMRSRCRAIVAAILFCLTSRATTAHGQRARFELNPAPSGSKWYKGNTHTHTLNSDGDTSPEDVARWYKSHGYAFLVLSDHNVFTDPKILASLMDSTFLLLPGEEVTTAFQKAAVHVNALAITRVIPAPKDSTLLGTVQKAVDAIRAEHAVPHINHPNFLWSVDSATLFRVKHDKLFEIFNGHPLTNNIGGGDWPGMEEVWDGLLSAGKRMYGIAVDDAHNFQGEFAPDKANPGRGWLVIHAPALETRALVTALEAGQYYASSGVMLDDVATTATSLQLRITQRGSFKYTTQFIGAHGKILATDKSLTPTYTLRGTETYVRAKVMDSGGASAWVQPQFTSAYRNQLPYTERESASITDTLRIHYVGYGVGTERYSISTTSNGLLLTDDIDYTDRARRTHLVSSLQMAPDFSPRLLEVSRITDSTSRVETHIAFDGATAHVIARGETTTVAVPAIAAVINGTAPVAQHLALVRYWLAHGRPAALAVVPGGPTNIVHIAQRGRDTLTLNGRRLVFDRFMIDGVVWGKESVWLDRELRLAAFTTAGGGGLSFEAVRLELDPLFEKFQTLAARDRMADLAQMTRSVTPVATGSTAFVGATLIDGTGHDAVTDATIVVKNGRITSVGPRATTKVPSGTRVIDVHGKTIMPGLWEMHGHLMQIEWGPVYLASGVTTARDMGNVIPFVIPFRDAIQRGALGPRMLLAGLIDGGGPNAFGAINAQTPDEGRAAVRRYHALGFEQMKLYSLLQPAVVAAICNEAHKLGMTVTGHVPTSLSLLAAIDSGMDQIAHLPIRGDASSDSVKSIIAALRAHGTVIDPTVSWGEILGHALTEPVSNFQPGVSHLPPVLAQRITRMGTAGIDANTAHTRLARTLGIIKALHEAGVPIVAGTDEGVPGFSVYREIELYVQAGFSPMEALRAATAIPARAMHLDGDVGTLEVGKRADLIVLDANPLDRIENIRSVQMVMRNGTLFRSADVWRAVGFH